MEVVISEMFEVESKQTLESSSASQPLVLPAPIPRRIAA